MRQAYILAVFLVMILSNCAFAAGQVTINVKEQVICEGREVLLRDIAEISGGDAAARNNLGSIVVCNAPAQGQYIRITAKILLSKISRAVTDPASYSANVPPVVKILSKTYIIYRNDLIKAAREYLQSKGKWSEDLRAGNPMPPSTMQVPSGKIAYKCSISEETNNTNAVVVKVDVLSDQKTAASGTLYFYLSGKSAASKNRAEKHSGSSGSEKSEQSQKVKRGDALELYFVKKNLTIVIPGNAAEDGYPGDRIKVTCQQDKRRMFSAILQNTKTAIVELD